MALTKVRLPVVDIARVSNGTSQVDIPTAGGSIVTSVGGTTAVTYASSGVTVALPLSVTNIDDVENVDLTVSGGASATMEAISSALRLWTTSAHPMIIGSNSSANLTLETSGKVTLLEQGTGSSQLVDKAYVDNAVSGTASNNEFDSSSTGSLVIATDGDDFIINWGVTASIAKANEAVTFDTAFPNAVLGAYATRIANQNQEDSANVNSVTTTGMNVAQTGSASTQVYWLAIGF